MDIKFESSEEDFVDEAKPMLLLGVRCARGIRNRIHGNQAASERTTRHERWWAAITSRQACLWLDQHNDWSLTALHHLQSAAKLTSRVPTFPPMHLSLYICGPTAAPNFSFSFGRQFVWKSAPLSFRINIFIYALVISARMQYMLVWVYKV